MATQYPEQAKKMREGSAKSHQENTNRKESQKPEEEQDFLGRLASKAGNFEGEVHNVITSKPLVALAAALGFGFIASLALRRLTEQGEGGESSSKGRSEKTPLREVH